ncbi:alpha/beta hydrolase (plasmid) [Rhizobium sp. 32-5/1]|uniref:alpha/beta fold hydrolase n=1 Tax=Rhizobium sp. 32-5/1 TaxID=3019602 RepID=UPI00240D44EF|nr:alpha/beta hydrolase [Rhizobium sp. 32-5/1]WEZ85371.1 alpha/beta hydrolase [Rhizobium sp. 32-5/1]
MKEGKVIEVKSWAFYTEPEKLNVAGVDVAYRRKGSGAPVVYFHGAGLTRRWLPFYDAMATYADVIVPEHPGFGDTPMPEWLEDFDDINLHYEQFFDELGLDRFHLVGHSLGGWMAAHYAVFFSRRLLSLQLITPAGLRGSLLNDPFRQTGEEALERVFNGEAHAFPEYLEGDERVEQLVHDYAELTAQARLMWNPRYDPRLERRLARVRTPTQVITVDEDRIMNADVALRYADLIPGAETAKIRGATRTTSHVPYVQEPEALASLIAEFVNRHPEA